MYLLKILKNQPIEFMPNVLYKKFPYLVWTNSSCVHTKAKSCVYWGAFLQSAWYPHVHGAVAYKWIRLTWMCRQPKGNHHTTGCIVRQSMDLALCCDMYGWIWSKLMSYSHIMFWIGTPCHSTLWLLTTVYPHGRTCGIDYLVKWTI